MGSSPGVLGPVVVPVPAIVALLAALARRTGAAPPCATAAAHRLSAAAAYCRHSRGREGELLPNGGEQLESGGLNRRLSPHIKCLHFTF